MWYPDATPDGYWICAVKDRPLIETSDGSVNVGRELLYPRCTTVGGKRFAGQDHFGAGNFEWSAQTGTNRVGDSFDVNPVIYDNLGVLIQARGPISHQGYRYVGEDNVPRTGNATVFDGELNEYTEFDGVKIGQIADKYRFLGCGVRINNGPVLLLEAGGSYFIRVQYSRATGIFAISIAKHGEGICKFYWATKAELAALTEIGPAPVEPPVDNPPPPPPPPPPTENNVRLSQFPGVLPARDRFAEKFPLPIRGNGQSQDEFEEVMRSYVRRLAEYIKWSTGDGKWGTKSADPNRPQSKDAIAYFGPPLLGFDMYGGVGTGQPSQVSDPVSADIAGQNFISVVARNHVGDATTPPPNVPPPNVPPPAPGVDLVALLKRVAELDARLSAIEISAIKDGDKVAFQAASGKFVCAEDSSTPAQENEFVKVGRHSRPKGSIIANRDAAGPWETFHISKE